MNLQNPKKFKMLIDQAHEAALNVLRPISRKYDKAEHACPKELDMLSSLVDGMNAGAAVNKRGDTDHANKNGVNMSTTLSIVEMCYGDTGLLLSMPWQGLGNPEIDPAKGFAGVMETFDNTRPLVATMAVGCAKASLERIKEIFKDKLDAGYATP